MKGDFIEDLPESGKQGTSKPFSQVFKIEDTKLGIQISFLVPIKIGKDYYDQDKKILNGDLLINGVSLYELQSKKLNGWIHPDNNVFNITGCE